MRYIGGLAVLLFAYTAFTGWTPFPSGQSSRLPPDARRAYGRRGRAAARRDEVVAVVRRALVKGTT